MALSCLAKSTVAKSSLDPTCLAFTTEGLVDVCPGASVEFRCDVSLHLFMVIFPGNYSLCNSLRNIMSVITLEVNNLAIMNFRGIKYDKVHFGHSLVLWSTRAGKQRRLVTGFLYYQRLRLRKCRYIF